MADPIIHQEEHLGSLHFDQSRRVVLEAKSLQALETLLTLDPEDEIELPYGIIKYSTFRDEYLTRLDAIYPSAEAYLRKEVQQNLSH